MLRFEGGVVLRSHLRMSGRWRCVPRGAAARAALARPPRRRARGRALGRPRARAAHPRARAARPRHPRLAAGARARCSPGSPGPTGRAASARPCQDQTLVAGIGNMWMAETLWEARLSPWLRLAEVAEPSGGARSRRPPRRDARSASSRPRAAAQVYGRAGRPCPRCRTPIRSCGQGDANRTRLLVPGLPARRPEPPVRRPAGSPPRRGGRRPAPGRVDAVGGAPRAAPLPVAARVLPRGLRGRARRRAAVRLRGAPDARRARRSTSTGRSCAASSRSRRRRCAGCPTRATRSTTSAASRPRRSSPTPTRASARATTTPSSGRSCCRLLDRGRRALRRLRLARRRVRGRLRLDRAVALRQRALLRRDRAARRRSRPARPSSSAAASASASAVAGEVAVALARGARADAARVRTRHRPAVRARAGPRARRRARREPPDAAGELADAVSALRLATAGAIAAGPVVFERLDFRPLRISPLLPIAATKPRGEGCRLDALRGALAADLRERLPLADDDRELGEALDRWELSLFADEPFRSGQLRDALDARCSATGDGAWAASMRAAVLLAEQHDRAARRCSPALRAERAGAGSHATPSGARSSRRCCTATAASSSRRSTRRCSACGRARHARSPPERARRAVERSALDARPRGVKEPARARREWWSDRWPSPVSSLAPVCSAASAAPAQGARQDAGDRARQPEGRRRQDDDDAQPRRRARRAGAARPLHRPRSAGQPDDVAGAEPGHDRALDVRRARPPACRSAR